MPIVTDDYHAVASITEVRNQTQDVVDLVRASDKGVLVQKNNQPLGVVISNERYLELLELERRVANE